MNEPTDGADRPALIVKGLREKKRTRKPSDPRAPRVIDPGVKAIRDAASKQIKEYHRAQASGRILKTILDKRLAQLTEEHKRQLYDHLSQIITPPLKANGQPMVRQ